MRLKCGILTPNRGGADVKSMKTDVRSVCFSLTSSSFNVLSSFLYQHRLMKFRTECMKTEIHRRFRRFHKNICRKFSVRHFLSKHSEYDSTGYEACLKLHKFFQDCIRYHHNTYNHFCIDLVACSAIGTAVPVPKY